MNTLFIKLPMIFLILIFLGMLALLVKASDKLVDESIEVSRALNIPELVIGATIVSLGTTLPELSSSIASLFQGVNTFALGNVVGSIITNTTLIVGVGILFGEILINRTSRRQVMILLGLSSLLIVSAWITHFTITSLVIPQWVGFVLLGCFPLYLWSAFKGKSSKEITEHHHIVWKSVVYGIAKILGFAFIVTTSAAVLVECATIIASTLGVSDVIISSTIVALGTSLPELSTVITSVKKGHGAVAIGNVLGANILNILLVLGVSLIFSTTGIQVSEQFLFIQFSFLIGVIVLFIVCAQRSLSSPLKKVHGILLLVVYLTYMVCVLGL